jgi:hypothetical protein
LYDEGKGLWITGLAYRLRMIFLSKKNEKVINWCNLLSISHVLLLVNLETNSAARINYSVARKMIYSRPETHFQIVQVMPILAGTM